MAIGIRTLGALAIFVAAAAHAGTDRVKMFIKDLRADTGEIRAGAALALGEAGDPRAVEPLKAVLDDEFIDVRKAAAWALGELGDKSASRALQDRLEKDRAPQVRMASAASLGKLRVSATAPSLKAALADVDSGVRSQSIEALASVAGNDAIPDAQDLLRDDNWSVRCSAANALGALRSKDSVSALSGVLALDGTDYVRASAAHALGRIGDKAAMAALKKALKDPSAKVVGEAASSLLALGFDANDPEFKAAIDPESLPAKRVPDDGNAVEL